MKDLFHKISALALSAIVLLSTMSFTVDMHYCGDHLVDFSFSDSAASCMMKAEMSKSSAGCADMDMKMDCCTDVQIVLEGQDDLKVSFDQLTFDQQLFVASFIYTYINLFEGYDDTIIPFKEYSPPPLIRDVQLLHQTFLI